MSFLNRTYRLQFVRDDGQAIEWVQTPEEVGLAIDFKATKTISKEPNACEVKIYNLSQDSMAFMMQGGQLWLHAGYSNRNDIVFAGSVVQTSFDIESDGTTSLTISTISNLALKDQGNCYMALEMPASSSSTAIIKKIVDYIKANIKGIKISKYVITSNVTYKAAIASYADCWTLLDTYCFDCGYIYWIDNGAVNIQKNNGTIQLPVVEINSETGLIGAIKPVSETSKEGKTRIGVEFETILNPSLNVAGKVRVTSATQKQVNGIYRVESLEHAGNSHMGRWTSKAKAWKV